MNLFTCEKCHKTFATVQDNITTCKFCKIPNTIKKIDLDLKKTAVVAILEKPLRVKDLTNQELLAEHFNIHQVYGMLKRLEKYEKEKTKDMDIENVIKAHTFIVEEMECRKMNHKVRSILDRDTSKLRKKIVKNLNWGDITLVEDVVSIVGSALYKENPHDVDVICKFKDLSIIEEKLKEIVKQKEGLDTHIVKGEPHGEYLPKYDLILKERKSEIKINKVINYNELIMPLQYMEKTHNTDKFVVEPYLKARRLMIYRKDENVEIYLGNGTRIHDKKLEERVNTIIEPTDFIIDTLQLKNGTLVIQDILAKDNCNLLDDPLLSRKTFIWKMKIPRQASIAFIKFKYCKSSEELIDEVNQYKIKKSSCILKPAFSTYESKAGWLKLSYEEPIKLDLGCGQRKKKGYLGIDKVGYPGIVDIKHDCEDGIPLDDNSCSIVRMNHSAEHFADPKFLMEEVYRVLKDGGIVVMTVPEASTYGAQNHPDHKSFWTENDINYFVDEDLIKKHEVNCHFKLLKKFKKEFYTNNIKRIHLSWILKKLPLVNTIETQPCHDCETDKKFKQKKILIRKYGTSEGASRAWDTRGRGQKEEPKKEEKTRGQISIERDPITGRLNVERKKLIAEDLGVEIDNPIVTNTQVALNKFTDLDYKDIRRLQNSPKIKYSTDKQDIEYGNLIENYIDKSPKYRGNIYRGIKMNPEGLESLKEGNLIDMKGTSSWTSSGLEKAKDFGEVLFECSNATKAVAIAALSNVEGENEVLVSKKSKFKILKIDKNKVIIPGIKGDSRNPPTEKIFTIVKLEEIIKKNFIFKKEDKREIVVNQIQNRIESDKYIDIYDKDGNLVYSYSSQPVKKEYFIVEKPIYSNLDDMIKTVRKIGSKWCVVHGHPPKPGSKTDKPIGSVIKCFPTKEQAEKMHQAILISQAREAGAFKRKKIMIRKKEKANIQEIVNLDEWQKLRESLIGQWKDNPEQCISKLRSFLGGVKETDNRRLRIVENYLTGSGFRSGEIKHPEIDKLLKEVKNEIDKRKKEGKWLKRIVLIRKYGTSEGAVRAWDTRGRGQNESSTSGKISREHEQKIRDYVINNKIGDYVGIQYGVENKPELILYNDKDHSTRAIEWNKLPKELQKMETEPIMTEEIGHPTQLITEKPKKKIRVVIHRRKRDK